jgi:hypothetical protein
LLMPGENSMVVLLDLENWRSLDLCCDNVCGIEGV